MVSKNDSIMKILEEKPQAESIMLDFGLHCVGCAISAQESLEEGAKAHGLSEKEIKELVERIERAG